MVTTYKFGDIVKDKWEDEIFVTVGYNDGSFEGIVIKSDMYKYGATIKVRDMRDIKECKKVREVEMLKGE